MKELKTYHKKIKLFKTTGSTHKVTSQLVSTNESISSF